MKVIVQGVVIELTAMQVAKVEKEIRKRKLACKSFEKMLTHFGFKRYPREERPDINDWVHSYYDWYVDIQQQSWGAQAWAVGEGLKQGSFPGGWMYGEPEELAAELTRVMDELQKIP